LKRRNCVHDHTGQLNWDKLKTAYRTFILGRREYLVLCPTIIYRCPIPMPINVSKHMSYMVAVVL